METYTAIISLSKSQCRMFLMDRTSEAVNQDEVNFCQSLQCQTTETPNRIFKAGPPLDGTICRDGHCGAGDCVSLKSQTRIWRPLNSACKSSCIKGSTGVSTYSSFCLNDDCFETKVKHWTELCSDRDICLRRTSRKEFATAKCKALLRKSNVEGAARLYDSDNVASGCQIACKGVDEPRWKWRVVDHEEAKFPDGTLCHIEPEGVKFYCQNGNCVRFFGIISDSKYVTLH